MGPSLLLLMPAAIRHAYKAKTALPDQEPTPAANYICRASYAVEQLTYLYSATIVQENEHLFLCGMQPL